MTNKDARLDLLSMLRHSLGRASLSADEMEAFVAALSRRWSNALRLRREVELEALPFSLQPIPWYRLAFRRDESCQVGLTPSHYLGYAGGDYYLQDAGSLLALSAASAEADPGSDPLMICDLCAAPGGKASGLAEMLGDRGFLLANEPIRSRLPALKYNLARTGSLRYAISCLDPDQLAERLAGQFDLVLVDAPCSGQALLSRRRQTESSLTAKQIAHSAARQRRILDAAVRLLAEGGQLVYSTCTFATDENESQVARLLSQGLVAAQEIPKLAAYQSFEPACYRLWPHRHSCAGSFAASLHSVDSPVIQSPRTKRQRREQIPADLSQWFGGTAGLRMRVQESVIEGWPVDCPAWVESIALSGPELAHRTGQTWKPSHAAALRRAGPTVSPRTWTVDDQQAIRYLRGESISCPESGWLVVHWRDRPLGWIKASQEQGKNQLPAAARLVCESV